MGNQISLRPTDATSKIVLCDGSVREYEQQLTVAELMLEHPQQVVVEFHSALNQKRPAPLPADKKLDKNKVYLMLPVKRGKAVGLSGEECRRILLNVNSHALHSKFRPWFARLCQNTAVAGEAAGPPRVVQRKEEEFMEKKEEGCEFPDEVLPEMLEGARPEYLCRQFSGKGWKPSLDTITEKKVDSKLTRWSSLKSVRW